MAGGCSFRTVTEQLSAHNFKCMVLLPLQQLLIGISCVHSAAPIIYSPITPARQNIQNGIHNKTTKVAVAVSKGTTNFERQHSPPLLGARLPAT